MREFKWHMHMTSFYPLWISLIFINCWTIIEKNNVATNILELYTIIIVLILVNYSTIRLNKFIKKRSTSINKSTGIIKKASKSKGISSEYLMAYILPLLAFNFSELRDLIIFMIYFSILTFLCIRNDNVYSNIFLELKGYKFYNCDVSIKIADKEHTYYDCLMISRINLVSKINHEIKYYDFENKIFIVL